MCTVTIDIIKKGYFIYVNQPSSISKRELPFLGPYAPGRGRGTKKNSDWLKTASTKL